MTSSTPGADAPSAASPADAERSADQAAPPGSAEWLDPAHGSSASRTAPEEKSGGAQADRTAIRTSLAERFAAVRQTSDRPQPDAAVDPASQQRAPQAAARSPERPAHPAARTAPPPAAGPRFGATAPTSTPPVATGAARLGAEPDPGGPGRPGTPGSRPAGPRKVRLSLARVDPWSAMKLSFLLSIAIGIGIVVAAAAMWFLLDSMHVFADIRELLVTLDSEGFLELMEYVELDRVMSMAAIIAVVDILLITALSTLGAFLYNIVAALVGGLHLMLTDD